ncbi:MAG: methionyl-tRNA formyltransferase [Candidatus Cloacimonetes bacterium]|jgi:methionyl-tRNA formyltransferase|nr:methionyl-tRNA formyltransferase [Candidatus Cloacimonadota bacterium]
MNKINNIVFMGTPDFAVPTLEKLIQSNKKPVLVVTQPDKPKGRKLIMQASPVKLCAQKYDIPYIQPIDINDEFVINIIKSYKPDIIITVAYGMFLNKKLRTLCPFGAINLHPSLLPLHRGSDPIRNTLLSNDKICGVTVFFISAKMDSGNIIIQHKYPINDNDNFSTLNELLAMYGAETIMQSLSVLQKHNLSYSDLKNSFQSQNNSLSSYSSKLDKNDTYYNPRLSANELNIKIRSYAYEPGFICKFREKKLKLHSIHLLNTNSTYPPGTIISILKNQGFVVSTIDKDILIKEVQLEGKNKLDSWTFNIGARIVFGEKIEAPF